MEVLHLTAVVGSCRCQLTSPWMNRIVDSVGHLFMWKVSNLASGSMRSGGTLAANGTGDGEPAPAGPQRRRRTAYPRDVRGVLAKSPVASLDSMTFEGLLGRAEGRRSLAVHA